MSFFSHKPEIERMKKYLSILVEEENISKKSKSPENDKKPKSPENKKKSPSKKQSIEKSKFISPSKRDLNLKIKSLINKN